MRHQAQVGDVAKEGVRCGSSEVLLRHASSRGHLALHRLRGLVAEGHSVAVGRCSLWGCGRIAPAGRLLRGRSSSSRSVACSKVMMRWPRFLEKTSARSQVYMVPSRLPQPMRYIMWMIIHMM